MKKLFTKRWFVYPLLVLQGAIITFLVLYFTLPNPVVEKDVKGIEKRGVTKKTSDVVNEVADAVQNAVSTITGGLVPSAKVNTSEKSDVSNGSQNVVDNKDLDTPLDTSNWQTYTNNEYGYSVKYPEGWGKFVNPDNNVATISKSADSYDVITIYPYKNITTNLEKWFNEQTIGIENKYKKVSETERDGVQIIEFKQEGGMQEKHFVLKKENRVLDILVIGINEKELQEIINSFSL